MAWRWAIAIFAFLDEGVGLAGQISCGNTLIKKYRLKCFLNEVKKKVKKKSINKKQQSQLVLYWGEVNSGGVVELSSCYADTSNFRWESIRHYFILFCILQKINR